MSNLVEIKELGKCYGKKKVMNNLSLSLESGRVPSKQKKVRRSP